ncbi:hypothetical protein ACNAW0_27845 [Micromonospora sp. SL1-18]|uniref:hypothetical protein n=1 Tax=Micromonospora sp. SL1-18 TaxID=3399128 RepID=UPI003A4D5AFC
MFDFSVRQASNGQRPRWRNLLIWDYGPTVIPQEFTNNCRINQAGAHGYCGQNPFFFGDVSSATWRSWRPSETGYYSNSSLTSDSSQYHDDHYGSFMASGYSYIFCASMIHTGRWDRTGGTLRVTYHEDQLTLALVFVGSDGRAV